MGEVIRVNDKEIQMKVEKEYIKQCIEKDEQAQIFDIQKRQKKKAQAYELTQ